MAALGECRVPATITNEPRYHHRGPWSVFDGFLCASRLRRSNTKEDLEPITDTAAPRATAAFRRETWEHRSIEGPGAADRGMPDRRMPDRSMQVGACHTGGRWTGAWQIGARRIGKCQKIGARQIGACGGRFRGHLGGALPPETPRFLEAIKPERVNSFRDRELAPKVGQKSGTFEGIKAETNSAFRISYIFR
jgi:hypothetical protein